MPTTATMSKTEAARILVDAVTVYARRLGVSQVTKDFYEAYLSESRHLVEPGSPIARAVEARPSWRFIRTIARKAGNR